MDADEFAQIAFLRCKGFSVGLLVVNTTIDFLADLHGLKIQQWIEPGLGEQRGFNVSLPSGVPIHAEECVIRPELGVALYVDSDSITISSLAEIKAECKSILMLPEKQIIWEQTEDIVGRMKQ